MSFASEGHLLLGMTVEKMGELKKSPPYPRQERSVRVGHPRIRKRAERVFVAPCGRSTRRAQVPRLGEKRLARDDKKFLICPEMGENCVRGG